MAESALMPTLKGENKVDNKMVDEATTRIKTILTEHIGAAAYEVVDYLLDNFFDGDKENLKKSRLDGHKTFQKLLEAVQGETGKSKSWVYESIKLWHDRDLLGDHEPYMKLSISHRALLLKVNDIDEKKKFAEKFNAKQIPYKKAKEEVRPHSPKTDYTLLSRLINHPADFDEEEFKEKAGKVALRKTYQSLKEKQQFEIVKKAKQRVEKLEASIEKQKNLLEKAKVLESKLNDISAEVPGDSEE